MKQAWKKYKENIKDTNEEGDCENGSPKSKPNLPEAIVEKSAQINEKFINPATISTEISDKLQENTKKKSSEENVIVGNDEADCEISKIMKAKEISEINEANNSNTNDRQFHENILNKTNNVDWRTRRIKW